MYTRISSLCFVSIHQNLYKRTILSVNQEANCPLCSNNNRQIKSQIEISNFLVYSSVQLKYHELNQNFTRS